VSQRFVPGMICRSTELYIDCCCLCRDVRSAVAQGQRCADGRQSHGDAGLALPSGWRVQPGDQQRDAAGRGWLRVPDQWRWQSRSDPHRRDTGWVAERLLVHGNSHLFHILTLLLATLQENFHFIPERVLHYDNIYRKLHYFFCDVLYTRCCYRNNQWRF